MPGHTSATPLAATCRPEVEGTLRNDIHALIDRLPARVLLGIRPVLAKYAALSDAHGVDRCDPAGRPMTLCYRGRCQPAPPEDVPPARATPNPPACP